jgi:hypothetical protein
LGAGSVRAQAVPSEAVARCEELHGGVGGEEERAAGRSANPVSAAAPLPVWTPIDQPEPILAAALQGTWITALRNPAAWNSQFGLHRLTKFVERPLTGAGGQLDARGNLRASIPTPSGPQHKVGVDH